MKPWFALAFLLALALLAYLIFIRKPQPPASFRGPSGLPYVQGPSKPPPGK